MEITVKNRCWNSPSHTLGLGDSAQSAVESKFATRVMFPGRVGLIGRLRSGPQGTELGCLPLTLIPGPEAAEESIFKAMFCLWGITICCR